MRRLLLIGLMCCLGLAACGKKAPPKPIESKTTSESGEANPT